MMIIMQWKNSILNCGEVTILNCFELIFRRYDLTEQLKLLQCRTLIFVGENSQFHTEAVHMTSKLDRRYCALVEVTNNHLHVCLYLKRSLTSKYYLFLNTKSGNLACIAGPSMRITRNRGATTRNACTNGVLLHGIWPVQA